MKIFRFLANVQINLEPDKKNWLHSASTSFLNNISYQVKMVDHFSESNSDCDPCLEWEEGSGLQYQLDCCHEIGEYEF